MNNNYEWNLSKTDPMIIEITNNGTRVMSLFLGEAMELAGRKEIMKYVKECDRTPWLKKWQENAMEEVVGILKNNSK